MTVDYPTISEPATPDYVLAVLRDMHRHIAGNESSVKSQIILTFETTIDEWQEAMCDYVPWRDLADWMNHFWDIKVTYDVWKDVLELGWEKKLGDLCIFVAQHVRQQQIRPAHFLGTPCHTAGAFLTIRSILQQAGADASLIAPSTSLNLFARQYCSKLVQYSSLLAPGALPTVKVHSHPCTNITAWGVLLGSLLLLLGSGFAVIGTCVLLLCFPMNQLGLPTFLPTKVEFGELKTFRDLAEVIAKVAPELPAGSGL